jgi:predicted membrane channel-forming protein YqfA (hemolysin III family)
VLMVSIALLTIGICGVVPGLAMKGSFLLVVLILFVISAWFVILETDDKNRIRNHLRKIHISS